MSEFDPSTLAATIDAWERRPSVLAEAPYEAFRAAHRKEARYLWLLSRRFGPPKDLDLQALRHLLAWGLIHADATITELGERLLRATSARFGIGPDPFAAADVSATRFRW